MMKQSPCCRELSGIFFLLISQVLLWEKLKTDVGTSTVHWISDYLTGRLQFVHVHYVLSYVEVSKTGTPQGTVLSPFLFSLSSTDFSLQLCHTTCRNDSAVIGSINQEQEGGYRARSAWSMPNDATAAETDKRGVRWETHLPG